MGIFGDVGTGDPALEARMRLLHSADIPPSCLLPELLMIRLRDSSWLTAFRIMRFRDQALCWAALWAEGVSGGVAVSAVVGAEPGILTDSGVLSSLVLVSEAGVILPSDLGIEGVKWEEDVDGLSEE